MQAEISGVELFVMAYAWSIKGISYIASTCGKTVRHSVNYQSSFEDAYGNVATKELARPAVAHMLYEFLPLIDEHNKARQSALALEKCWPTKSGWFRVITTLVGMAAVDLQRWDRNVSCGQSGHTLRDNGMDDFDIIEMANLIARPLRTGELRFRNTPQPSQKRTIEDEDDGAPLVRIRGEDGSINYPKKNGKGAKPRQRACFVCRKYKAKTQNTQWMCRRCGMPFCSIPHGQASTCMDEHINSSNILMGCCKIERTTNDFTMPDEMRVYLRTRTGKQDNESRKRARTSKATAATPSPTRRC